MRHRPVLRTPGGTTVGPPDRGGGTALNVTFYGVRGSTPCGCAANQRYGGNTACVVLDAPGSEPIALDLGTGLRFWGEELPHDGSFAGHALVTHLHWDHVQGLPFFTPVLRPGARLHVHGPPQEGLALREAFDQFLNPPYFPVGLDQLAGEITFSELAPGTTTRLGDAEVTAAAVPHIGPTNGYRVELAGTSVAYVPDHQQPLDGGLHVDPAVVELCAGVDLLIHDAQFTPEEFAQKPHWGHCTVEYAVEVAARAGARRLALFHHDPTHGDDVLDRLTEQAAHLAAARGVEEVITAAERTTVALSAGVAARR